MSIKNKTLPFRNFVYFTQSSQNCLFLTYNKKNRWAFSTRKYPKTKPKPQYDYQKNPKIPKSSVFHTIFEQSWIWKKHETPDSGWSPSTPIRVSETARSARHRPNRAPLLWCLFWLVVLETRYYTPSTMSGHDGHQNCCVSNYLK